MMKGEEPPGRWGGWFIALSVCLWFAAGGIVCVRVLMWCKRLWPRGAPLRDELQPRMAEDLMGLAACATLILAGVLAWKLGRRAIQRYAEHSVAARGQSSQGS